MTDAHLQVILGILQKHVPAYPVWAFGSRVHGSNLKQYSDLDLAIITEQPLGLDELIALRAAFSDSDLPFRVDVVDYATIDAGFRSIIQATHEVLTSGRQD